MIGIGNSNKRCQVKNGSALTNGGSYAIGISYITGKNIDLFENFWVDSVQPTPAVLGVVMDKGSNRVSLVNESFNEVATNKAGCTGNKNLRFHSWAIARKIESAKPRAKYLFWNANVPVRPC